MMKLLRSLPSGKAEHIEWDRKVIGLGLRLRRASEGGVSSATFVFQYRTGPKQRRITMGRVSSLTLKRARQIAREFYLEVKMGGDPQGNRFALLKRRLPIYAKERQLAGTQQRISQLRRATSDKHS